MSFLISPSSLNDKTLSIHYEGAKIMKHKTEQKFPVLRVPKRNAVCNASQSRFS